jgi:molybdenum cofactor cytidylyltransferase
MKVILLAAGCSQRMGQIKQLMKWRGKTMLQHCLDKLEHCNLEIILVIGAFANEIKDSLDKQYHIVENPRWSSGMGTSIALGMTALQKSDEAIMIMLADQPAITSSDVKQLLCNWSSNPEQICCSYSEPLVEGNKLQMHLTVPAIFPLQYFLELSNLDDNIGAKAILKRETEKLTHTVIPNTLININTTDDWDHWLQQLAAQHDILEDNHDEIYTQ